MPWRRGVLTGNYPNPVSRLRGQPTVKPAPIGINWHMRHWASLLATRQCQSRRRMETVNTDHLDVDCQACGACCAHYANEDLSSVGRRGMGLFISNDDVTGLPSNLVVLYPFSTGGHDAWLRAKRVDGRWQCRALEGQIGVGCSCSVYEHRPKTCRDFEPGSTGCRHARKEVLGIEDD